MSNQLHPFTNYLLALFAIVSFLLLVKDYQHNSEPLENKGDDFGGWDKIDHDFNNN
jgi:hypothetical protein